RHQRRGIGESIGPMQFFKEQIKVFRSESGIFEKKQESEIVDDADDEPCFAAPQKGAERHQKTNQDEQRHRRPQRRRAKERKNDAEAGQKRCNYKSRKESRVGVETKFNVLVRRSTNPNLAGVA